MKYKTIDLCAGIGGIRRGFELTGGFENVLSAEIDAAAARTYRHLFGENPLNDLTSEEFKNKTETTPYDVLLAGFPCQTFSRAGLQMGFRDATKGTIFFDIADIISRTNPKAVFLENVENLCSHNKGKTLKTIIRILEDELGYKVIGVTKSDEGEYIYSRQSFVRNSRKFGLPQNRPRVFIMAFSKSIYGDAVKELCDALPEERVRGDIFKDLNSLLETDVDDSYYMSSGYLETLKKHKVRESSKGNGFGYVVVNEKGIAKPIANTILATGGSGKERNLIRQYKEGVAGKKLKSKRTALNSEGIRVMTPTEWGRLQGFIGYGFIDEKTGIDKFSFPEKTAMGQQYKQFGNSVTIPVIEEMAYFMLNCFEKMLKCPEKIIVNRIKENGYITKQEIKDIFRISTNQANALIRKMLDKNVISIMHKGRYAKYTLFND